jgi:hypothetical protein
VCTTTFGCIIVGGFLYYTYDVADSSPPAYAFDRIDWRTKKVTPALIAAVTERILSSLHPSQVILFGSQMQSKTDKGRSTCSFVCMTITQ